MKTCTTVIIAAVVALGSMATLSANEKGERKTRVLAGGRNAPMLAPAIPAKEQRMVAAAPKQTRTVLAGGRNAPYRVQPAGETFQVAPAFRRQR